MKLNKILLLYLVALPISISLRFLQLLFTVEPATGFHTAQSGSMGTVLLILILLCSLAVAIFSALTYKQPDNTPNGNIWLSLAALGLSLSIAIETLYSPLSLPLFSWQNILLMLFALFTSLYLIFFALSPIFGFKIKPIFSATTVIYSVMRLICDFTIVSKLAIISDNIILIAVYSVSMFFFLNFAKLYNGLQDERGYKKLLSCGLSLSVLSLTNSIPNILLGAIFQGFDHISLFTNITVLFLGVFSTAVVFSIKQDY